MNYPRKILKQLEDAIASKQIVVITGMRRVGKTTVMQMIYDRIESKNKTFLDIENPFEQKLFEELDYNNILGNLKARGITTNEKAYLFLDEIQTMPKIVNAIKYLYDHYDVKFFLTGSSSFYLKNLFTESLAGRKFIFELFPLDFEEFLIFKDQKKEFIDDFNEKSQKKNFFVTETEKKLYEEYLEYGGFPEVVLIESFEEKKKHLDDILKSYFEKDVKSLADFRDLGAFRDLILLLLSRIGSKVEISKLASAIGVSRETIYSYLYFLEESYFVHFAPIFSQNPDRSISKLKKLYFCDNGIINVLGRVAEGALFENAVYLNLRQKEEKVNYFEKNGQEIDFILPEKSTAFEVKLTGDDRDYQKLVKIANKLNLKNHFVITKSFVKKDGFIPAQDL